MTRPMPVKLSDLEYFTAPPLHCALLAERGSNEPLRAIKVPLHIWGWI